ncbi:MAG: GTPase HflX, partial [Chloroflexales bacterium]|nr:GTPase HflX [Chloroflexales bacterium]
MLVVDTVGFIQKLPHQVVAAFRATLEEVTEADLLVHVMDASAEDLGERAAAVESVLVEIGAGERPRVLVLNKADLLTAERRLALKGAHAGAVMLSARSHDGLAELREALAARLDLTPRAVRLRFRKGDARAIAS